jgi:hypothetical protein
VSPATAQRLARHSDINLTLGTYTRLGMEDLAGVVNNLPELRFGSPSTDAPLNTLSEPTVEVPQDADLNRLVESWPRLAAAGSRNSWKTPTREGEKRNQTADLGARRWNKSSKQCHYFRRSQIG